jgi:hypothetical protein
MAAPDYVPVPPTQKVRLPWESPDHVPSPWTLDRPDEVATGRQPVGPRLGYPGPDIGYALTLVPLIRPELRLAPLEQAADAEEGCVGIAMRRAAIYGRAPVIHDLRIAFTIWGFLDQQPPDELVAYRRPRFAGAAHDYETQRAIVDQIPDETLRLPLSDVRAQYPGHWERLVGSSTSPSSST